MKQATKRLSIGLLALFFIISLSVGLFTWNGFNALATSSSEVYYLGVDRTTKGYWYYVGDNESWRTYSFTETNDEAWLVDRDQNLRITGQTLGGYGNYWSCRDSEEITGVEFDPSLRKYGQEGMVGVYTKLQYGMFADNGDHRVASGDGQPCKDVNLLSDFTEDSQINYLEYPSWIEGDGIQCQANYLDYWQHSEDLIHGGFVRDKDLLSPDPYRWNRKVGQFATGNGQDISFTIPVTDDNFHMISVYVVNNYTYETASLSSRLEIYDLNGTLLCAIDDNMAASGAYFKFMVKGSVKIVLSGETYMSIAGLFFDPIDNSDTVQKTNFQTELIGSKTINLSWESNTPSATVILKKQKGDMQYSYLTTVPEGVDTFTDTQNLTGKEYEYCIISATKRSAPLDAPAGYTAFDNIYTYSGNFLTATQNTADYRLTDLDFEHSFFETYVNEEIIVDAVLKKNVIFSEGIATGGEPYANKEIFVTLYGDSIVNTLEGQEVEFIGTDLGEVFTDENGIMLFRFTPRYTGTYTLKFVTLDEDGTTVSTSYAGGEWETTLFVISEDGNDERPIPFEISQAVKPGQTVSISGSNFTDTPMLRVAYAKQKPGVVTRTYEEAFADPSSGIAYINREDMLDVSQDGTNLVFKLPQDAEAGVYDIWILNEYGWSEVITLNRPIPVFVSQEASYAGLPIEIVGRNFDPSEYGETGDFSDYVSTIRVRLTQIGDINGAQVDDPEIRIIGVKDGVKYFAKRDDQGNGINYENPNFVWGDTAHLNYSITGEDVYWSNPYKIAFDTPDVEEGTYKIEIAVDGQTYYELPPQYVNESIQQFKIYAKKAANYDVSIFGNEERIGNDPLGLEVYWAQDFKWQNVETIDAEFIMENKEFIPDSESKYEDEFELADATMANIRLKLQRLSSKGGGVLYFPEGHYFIHGGGSSSGNFYDDGRERGNGIEIPKNCAIVGAGYDKTFFELVYDNTYSSGLFTSGFDNVGIARLSMVDYRLGQEDEKQGNRADMFIDFYDPKAMNVDDNYALTTKNNFLVDLDLIQVKRTPYDFNGDKYLLAQYESVEGGRRLIKMRVLKNSVAKNIFTVPSEIVVHTGHYTKIECIESHADGANWKIGEKYVICENVLNDGGKLGHGLNGRSYAYCGSNYVTRQGQIGVGEGETFLFEPADIQCKNYGDVLGADGRRVTVRIVKGDILDSESPLCSNLFTMFIIGGKGAGQWRYVSRTPVAGLDGVYTGFTYKILDGEEDWDVIPDATSKYTVFPSLAYNTFYKNICTNSGGAILVGYSGTMNSIAVENICINTGGITTESINSTSSQLPTWYIRVENNYVYGGSHGIEEGIEKNISEAYTTLDYRAGIRCRIDQAYVHGDRLIYGLTFKENEVENVHKISAFGRELGFSGVIYIGAEGNVSIKNILVEGNEVHDTNNYGIYVGSNVSDCIVLNNSIYECNADEMTDINAGNSWIGAQLIFVDNDSILTAATGEYKKGEALPVLPDKDGMIFLGWTRDPQKIDEDSIIMIASGLQEKLYAVYGYQVSFDDNYDGGTSKIYKVSVDGILSNTVNPTYRSGYTFEGWFYDEDLKYAYDKDMPIKENTTLYAKWISKGGETAISPSLDDFDNGNGFNTGLIVGISLIGFATIEAVVFIVIILKIKKPKV